MEELWQEGTYLEFKREYVNDLNKEVIAFANTDGGKIYIGVDDDGGIIGVHDTDKVKQACILHIMNTVRPDVLPFVKCTTVERSGKNIIEIEVEKGSACPYYISSKGLRPEGVYVRIGSVSAPATDTAILKMIKDTDGEAYEDIRSLEQDLTFIETATVFDGKGMAFKEAQMRSLGIINESGLYTNLGLLLSEQCKHTIKIAVFDGVEKETFKDRHEFTGSVLKQMSDAYAFIDRYNSTRSTFDGQERIDERDYPVIAVREALANAVVHREYALGGSTLINIFDDRMELTSLGGLVKGIEYDDIMMGVSLSRNEKLANVFYRLSLIEAYGTGISKIMRAYATSDRKPTVEVTSNAFKTVLPSMKAERLGAAEESGYGAILALFGSKKYVSKSDVMTALGVSSSTATRMLSAMVDEKMIARIGNTRSIRYIKL